MMGVSAEIIEAARAVAAGTGVSAAVLLAVAIVESNARAFAPVGERREPLIRFEGHYFDRLLAEEPRRIARARGLAHPGAGAVRNPASQAARWALLERAAGIDEAAAYASTSWGLAQVMGSHWHALGYAGPLDLAERARASAEGQLEIAARFLLLGRLDRLLDQGDHAGFARRYNGPAYARHAYDERISAAHRLASRLLGRAEPLRRGARGGEVAQLQRALVEAGFALKADGVFGPASEAAVRSFQTRERLAVDGVAGPQTLARLSIAP